MIKTPLTKQEYKWLADVEKLLLACPSKRLAAYTCGDADLTFYDKDVANDWLSKNTSRRSELDCSDVHKAAGSSLGKISAGFQIDSCAG